jgi:Holliday junction resolvase RusA-like endonuclease
VKTYKGRMPFPPPLSACFDNAKGAGRVKSSRYKQWITAADKYAYLTPRVSFTMPVKCEWVLSRPDKRQRDLSNTEKALGDTLKRWGIVTDDSLIHHLTLRWAAPGEVPPGEVSVTVQELEKAS